MLLSRRSLLTGVAGTAAALSLPAWSRTSAAPLALYDALFEDLLRASPMTAAGLGLDRGERAYLKSRLDDRSYDARLNFLKPIGEAGPALAAVDRTALSGRELSDLDTIVWMSELAGEIGRFPYGGVDSYGYPIPYVVSQLTGSYQAVPDFLDSQHDIDTVEDAEAYLARLSAFARDLDAETERVRADAARGVIPPDFVIDKALAQMNALRAQSGEGAGLVESLARRAAEKGLAGDWRGRATALVDGPVAAALDRQIAALAALRPDAAHDAGVGRLPDGARYYEVCLRYQTSTGLSPDEAHAIGLEQVAEISARADALLRAQGLTEGGVGARLEAFGREARWLYPNTDAGREALLADLNAQVEAIRPRLPEVFNDVPAAGLDIRRVPPAIELGAPRGYAMSPSLDGSRPGSYYINLADTGIWPRWALPTLTYHEALPGHILQGAIALEAQGTPMLHRVLLFNAHGEGWGLYAEQLADELGMYEAFPEGRLGLLQSFLYRAARIVLDTGLHAHGWSRERAIAYMIETVGLDASAAESEVERYCVWPGQACGYKIGHTEIVRLREQARARLGDRFDIKGFHDAVLRGGVMPLQVLERVVDGWAASLG